VIELVKYRVSKPSNLSLLAIYSKHFGATSAEDVGWSDVPAGLACPVGLLL